MGTPHRWHPGTDRLRGRWTLSTPLLPDEIASSWLVRLAFVQGVDVLSLTGDLWPGWRCWTQDLDRGASEEHRRTLESASGLPADAFRAATIGSVIGCVADLDGRPRGRWPWTTTVGSRNTRRHGGLQFCPACLAEDAVPYYRLHWGLAWHAVCEDHAAVLLDRCPACQAPLEPHRLEVRDGSPVLCATCKRDLRAARGDLVATADPAVIAFQRAADAVMREGSAHVLGQSVTARQWFALAAFFATFLRRSDYHGGGPVRRVLEALDVSPPELDRMSRSVELESLRSGDRHALFARLGPMLSFDRDTLASALAAAAITRQALCPKGTVLPDALEDVVRTLPERVVLQRKRTVPRANGGPRSRRAVETMMAALERRLARRAR